MKKAGLIITLSLTPVVIMYILSTIADEQKQASANSQAEPAVSRAPVLVKKTASPKVKKSVLTRELWNRAYKELIGALRDGDTKGAQFLSLSVRFSSFVKYENIESITKTKKGWFSRVSKGLNFLYLTNRKMESLEKRGDKEGYKKQQALFDKTKSRLVSVAKLRRKEYAITK